jgi:hypothetical protein
LLFQYILAANYRNTGTPAACAYANTRILTEFETSLLYYRRCIDDIFGTGYLPQEITMPHREI